MTSYGKHTESFYHKSFVKCHFEMRSEAMIEKSELL